MKFTLPVAFLGVFALYSTVLPAPVCELIMALQQMVLHVFVQLKELRKIIQVIFLVTLKTFDFIYELGLGKLGTVNCKEHLLPSLAIRKR